MNVTARLRGMYSAGVQLKITKVQLGDISRRVDATNTTIVRNYARNTNKN